EEVPRFRRSYAPRPGGRHRAVMSFYAVAVQLPLPGVRVTGGRRVRGARGPVAVLESSTRQKTTHTSGPGWRRARRRPNDLFATAATHASNFTKPTDTNAPVVASEAKVAQGIAVKPLGPRLVRGHE